MLPWQQLLSEATMSDQINIHRDFENSTLSPEEIKSQLNEIQTVLQYQSMVLQNQDEKQKEQEELQKELMAMYKNIQGFLTVLGWFERIAIFIGKTSIAAGAIWATFKYLVREDWHK